ncbi:hypothetical protein [Marinomonas shanghaiensis]|uniref:hypothetical protein n=1 Tax=Marinomonas shanghaiensis TaxID=2202418 RepID=UPI003A8D930B
MKMMFGFTNIYFLGNEHFEQQNWNKISFDLGGYENELVCNIHKSALAGLRGSNRTTCMLYCIGSGINEAKLHARSIARLLSFALDSHCYVSSFRTDDINVPAISQPTRGYAIQRNPVIDENDGKALKSFLTQTYEKYRQLCEVRSLDVVIELLNLADNKQPMELKLATVFILLENLKATYANEKGYIREKASYYKTEEDRRSGKRRLGFQKVLDNMFKDVGMTRNGNTLKDIVDLRNDIIHTAMSELSFETQWKRYVSCRNLIAEYLLRLLSYRGKFSLYDGSGITTKLIE